METPTIKNVDSRIKLFYQIQKNKITSDTISSFFLKYSENKDLKIILMKVTLLNKLFNTNIIDVYTVANHILELSIDNDLKKGNLNIVDKIKKIKIKDKNFNFYSFATKFCNKHKPNIFPIYDSYVDKALYHFRDEDRFSTFKRKDLKEYNSFVEIISNFKTYYKLTEKTDDEIDIFLWSIGRELIN